MKGCEPTAPGDARSPGGLSREIVNPFDRSPLARVASFDAAGAGELVRRAAAAFADRARWPAVPDRCRALALAADRIAADSESWAQGITAEGGKPIRDARVEVARAVDGLRHCSFLPRAEAGRGVPMDLNPSSAGRVASTRLEPAGVVLAYSAFNHPLNLAVHQAGPALAAGCPVVLKPAEATPLTALRLVALLHECGVPPDWVSCLVAHDLSVAAGLVPDPRLALLSFIGSARVGWDLRARLAPGVRCVLEHGGSAPVIVMPDARLDDVVPQLVKSSFVHAGQVCVSTQRVLVVGPRARAVAEEIAHAARALRTGDPRREETDVGPLIRPAEIARLAEWVDEAAAGGAEILCGGKPAGSTTWLPTVLWNPPAGSRVVREEVFGPVVSVLPVPDLDAAIAAANALPFAFQSSIFTRDLDAALRAAGRLDAGTVLVNDPTTFRVDWMPFGGHRLSGLGTGGIPFTYRDCLREKLVVMRP